MSDQSRLVIPVDAEHGGLRFVVLLAFLFGWVIIFIVLNQVIPSAGLNVIAIFGSFILTYLLSTGVERLLKRTWRSGRQVEMDPERVRLVKNGAVEAEINADATVNVSLWRFQTQRRSRVPKGWTVIACALSQDDDALPVYAFMSPDQAKNFADLDRFKPLVSKKDAQQKDKGDLLLAGEQRRLHEAENLRWQMGAEMTLPEFEQFIARLREIFPQWMPLR